MTDSEKLDMILSKMENPVASPVSDNTPPADRQFVVRRWLLALLQVAVYAALTWVAYDMGSLVFMIPFALLFVSLFDLALIIKDEIIFPGNTIGKIAQSPVALAVYFLGTLVLAAAIVLSVSRITPDAQRGEAGAAGYEPATKQPAAAPQNDAGGAETSAETYRSTR